MLLDALAVDPVRFHQATGWEAKPEGLCKGEQCVPVPGAIRADGLLDVQVAAERLAMAMVHDEAHALWALGPAGISGKALDTAVVPPIVLGEHLFEREGQESAAPWWREAHRLQPSNWTYKRQAWSLATTKPGDPSDLIQEPTGLYEGNWLDDLVAQGGPSQYTTAFSGPAG